MFPRIRIRHLSDVENGKDVTFISLYIPFATSSTPRRCQEQVHRRWLSRSKTRHSPAGFEALHCITCSFGLMSATGKSFHSYVTWNGLFLLTGLQLIGIVPCIEQNLNLPTTAPSANFREKQVVGRGAKSGEIKPPTVWSACSSWLGEIAVGRRMIYKYKEMHCYFSLSLGLWSFWDSRILLNFIYFIMAALSSFLIFLIFLFLWPYRCKSTFFWRSMYGSFLPSQTDFEHLQLANC